jgi:hypothetical protein
MGSDAIALHVAPSGNEGAYAFTCPECREEVTRPANRKTVALLVAAGVEIRPLEELDDDLPAVPVLLPYEDRAPISDAPALTMDDLITFHFLLEDDRELADRFV